MMERDVETQFGPLVLAEAEGALISVRWGRSGRADSSEVLDAAVAQMRDYDAGVLTAFHLPLRVAGSALQQDVCAAMQAIPYGETVTYGDISRQLGVPAQAVGQACGGNPLPIVIPCHRVVGAQGLTGFSGDGGVETKVALLRHEGGMLI